MDVRMAAGEREGEEVRFRPKADVVENESKNVDHDGFAI